MGKILLTGYDGFIGSALRAKLDMDGHKIFLPKIDITKYKEVEKYVGKVKPDYLIHLASTNSVIYSYDHYMEVLETNFMATVNLAEACRRLSNFRQFIFPSSSEVYGNALKGKGRRLSETARIQPNSPHAVAKASAELYIEHLGRLYNFPYTILRPSNTYGRTKDLSFFIEGTIKQMRSSNIVRIGNPDAVRDFLFLDDHVDAYMKTLGKRKAVGQTINICTGKGHATSEVARMIAKLINFEGKIIYWAIPKRPMEARAVICDNSKARRILGWSPRYTLNEGLKETIARLNKR